MKHKLRRYLFCKCCSNGLQMFRALGQHKDLVALLESIMGLLKNEWVKTREGCYESSISRATSRWHSAHLPTNSKSPPLMAPLKLVIVTS